jgi:hypothetical protein
MDGRKEPANPQRRKLMELPFSFEELLISVTRSASAVPSPSSAPPNASPRPSKALMLLF